MVEERTVCGRELVCFRGELTVGDVGSLPLRGSEQSACLAQS